MNYVSVSLRQRLPSRFSPITPSLPATIHCGRVITIGASITHRREMKKMVRHTRCLTHRDGPRSPTTRQKKSVRHPQTRLAQMLIQRPTLYKSKWPTVDWIHELP